MIGSFNETKISAFKRKSREVGVAGAPRVEDTLLHCSIGQIYRGFQSRDFHQRDAILTGKIARLFGFDERASIVSQLYL